MKKIKEMIETASTKSMAMDMLNTMRIFGKVSDANYKKGRKLITNEFKK